MKIPRDIEEMLQASGQPWRIVVGGRHLKIMVRNRLVGVLPKSPSGNRDGFNSRAHKNVRAGVRRAIRQGTA